MKFKTQLGSLLVAAAMGLTFAAPATAHSQSINDLIKHRQKTKNDWRNLAYAGAGVGLWGLLKHDSTLTFVGAAGALYSAYRYEQDRKSQSKLNRARAAMFSRGSFTRNGVRYTRRTTYKNGKKYYYFARA
jgi:hypothetical protein